MTPNVPFARTVQPSGSIARFDEPVSSSALSPSNYAFLQKYIHAESGIVIDEDKHYLLEARLLPIVRQSQLESLDALSTRLASRASPSLAKLVIEAMTTNETLFFRDAVMFDALRKEVFPAMFDLLKGKRKLRIWSAAASSGQEAYSIAMMMLEMGRGKEEFEIIGTDISNQILERASQAKYVQFEVNRGLPTPYLMKYFNRSGLDWQLKDEVRNLVRYEQLDLRKNFRHLGNFDLILCRNVLIYFDTETKRPVVEALRACLAPHAILVLGCSETVINVHDGFRRNAIGNSTFYSLK
jgi:chemotaxis protein methyltransferase CheR